MTPEEKAEFEDKRYFTYKGFRFEQQPATTVATGAGRPPTKRGWQATSKNKRHTKKAGTVEELKEWVDQITAD